MKPLEGLKVVELGMYTQEERKQFIVTYAADNMLKSTSVNSRLILEQTITRLLLVSNGEKI